MVKECIANIGIRGQKNLNWLLAKRITSEAALKDSESEKTKIETKAQ